MKGYHALAGRFRVTLIATLLMFAACAGELRAGQDRAEARLARWHALLAQRDATEWDKLDAVTRFFSQIEQQDDVRTWGVIDYWATPEELLRVGAGDCEDFAIAKYVTLIAMGVASERLQLAVTRAYSGRTRRIERHMVLLYRAGPDERAWVLDNLTTRIAPKETRTDLSFVSLADESAAVQRALAVAESERQLTRIAITPP